ncbi:alpha/beta hydrolase-fold protein [soil metagenome]
MNRYMLTAWLLAPFVIVGGLWIMVDRDAARKDRAANMARAYALMEPGAADSAPASASAPAAAGGKLAKADLRPEGFVIVVKDLSGKASRESPIHIASSWNGWNPADDAFTLTPRSDLRWQIVLKPGKIDAPIEFKFTRGTSDSWESNADLTSRTNRTLPAIDLANLKEGERPTFEFEVAGWEDMRPSSAARPDLDPYSTLPTEGITGTIKRLQVAGGGVATVRDLLVWLPPNYDAPENASRTYPVLYLHDGQNLFTKLPTTPGEWQIDETATKLITEGKVEPLIIVGIPHGGKSRSSEYLPFEMMPNVTPRGQQHVQWLVQDVMPRVERAFRVKRGPENTAVGGASLGAIISLYAMQTHPELFGKVLLESMPTTNADGAAMKFFASPLKPEAGGARDPGKPMNRPWPMKLWFAMGDTEMGTDAKNVEKNAQLAASVREFETMATAHLPAGGITRFQVEKGAQHNELAWARRFPAALEFLFPASPEKAPAK